MGGGGVILWDDNIVNRGEGRRRGGGRGGSRSWNKVERGEKIIEKVTLGWRAEQKGAKGGAKWKMETGKIWNSINDNGTEGRGAFTMEQS